MEKAKKIIKELIPYIVILIIVILIRSFLISPARVNGASMEDTLYDGEIVLVNKIALKREEIERYDIVVIKSGKDLLVKRIIGLPGDSVKYEKNILYINDEEVETPFEFEFTGDFEAVTVDENEYFVLGDNRNESKDSRFFGNVSIKQITGKVNFILFPFKKFGKIEE